VFAGKQAHPVANKPEIYATNNSTDRVN